MCWWRRRFPLRGRGVTTAVESASGGVGALNNFASRPSAPSATYFNNAYGTEFTTPDGKPYTTDFVQLANAFGIAAARVQEPDELPAALTRAVASGVPYLLDVWTRGGVPMPPTGHGDIAEFLVHGNDCARRGIVCMLY